MCAAIKRDALKDIIGVHHPNETQNTYHIRSKLYTDIAMNFLFAPLEGKFSANLTADTFALMEQSGATRYK